MGLGLLLLISYGYFLPAPASNEISRFSLVRSVVERGRLDIDPYAETTADVARRGGHAFSDKAPGSAFVAVPIYAAYAPLARALGADAPAFTRLSQLRGRPALPGDPAVPSADDPLYFNAAFRRAVFVCNLGTNVVAGAGLGVLFFLLLLRWGRPAPAALAATVALSGGSLIFAYSTMFFGHVLAATALFAAFVCLDRAESGGARRGWWTVAAGLLAGLGVLIELPVALGGGLLAAFVVTAPGPARARGRALALFAAGAVPPLLALAAYQTAAFGAPWSSGYAHLTNPTFAAGMSRGLLGVGWPQPRVLWQLLFGRSRGLLYLAPVLGLALVGLARGVRARDSRRRAVTAAAIVIAFLLMNAGYYMWWGGAALGPRHVIPAIPFLCLGFAWLFPELPASAEPSRRWREDLFIVLLAVSLCNQLAAVAVSPLAPPGIDVLFTHTYGRLLRGQIAVLPGSANWGMLLGLRGVASLLPLLAVWGLGAALIRKTLRRAEDEPI